MEITVDRTNDAEGNLVFTITAKNPNIDTTGVAEITYMQEIEKAANNIQAIENIDGKLLETAQQLIDDMKSAAFNRVIDNLEDEVKNSLEPKFDRMCREIYNWIYDQQNGDLKRWLQEYDPERVRYYFDNDKTVESDYEEDDD